MKRATLSTIAQKDALGIVEWIAEDSITSANGFRDALDSALILIADHPLIGPGRPEITTQPIRFFSLRGFPYVIVYDPDPTPPLILRILHGARDLPDLLRDGE